MIRLSANMPSQAQHRHSEGLIPSATSRDKAREWFVFFVIVVFWMVLLEGVLRKWVAPGLSKVIFFIRDPFLIMAYVAAMGVRQRIPPHPVMLAGLAIGMLAIPLLVLTVASSGNTVRFIVGLYGWRAYFLYIPLPFLMWQLFRPEDTGRLIRHICYAVCINGPLTVFQFESAPDSVINRGIGEDESTQFQSFSLVPGRIRPSGWFTSAQGNNQLIIIGFAVVQGLMLMKPHERPIGRLMFLVTFASALASIAVSGSRSAFVMAIIIMGFSACFALLAGSVALRAKAIIAPLAIFTAAVVLFPILFPSAVEAMIARTLAASASESQTGSVTDAVVNRSLGDSFAFLVTMQRVPVIGIGLGMGGNARRIVSDFSEEDARYYYAEAEWQRHFVDLGLILAPAYILFRLGLWAMLIAQTYHATRRLQQPFSFVLLSTLLLGTINGQVTGHGTVGGFFWLTLGLHWSASNFSSFRKQATATSLQPVNEKPPDEAETLPIAKAGVVLRRSAS